MARLILLEDEPTLRELAGFLAEQGHVIDGVGTVAEFRANYSPADHLIALIDLGLPDGDGIDLIEWLRSRGKRLGIIVISARTSLGDKVRGLSSDYRGRIEAVAVEGVVHATLPLSSASRVRPF